jgi:hypothetical protein
MQTNYPKILKIMKIPRLIGYLPASSMLTSPDGIRVMRGMREMGCATPTALLPDIVP